MAILIIVPKDATDCNQLVSLLHSANIVCMNSDPTPIRQGVAVKTWTWEGDFDKEYYIPNSIALAWTLKEHAGAIQKLTVNELARLLATP